MISQCHPRDGCNTLHGHREFSNFHMGDSTNGGSPTWMVYNGNPIKNKLDDSGAS
jgi:hypothetical protein